MNTYLVYNGYVGNGAVACIVSAVSEPDALKQAADAFKAEGGRPGVNYSTPYGRWTVEKIELPYVCEIS